MRYAALLGGLLGLAGCTGLQQDKDQALRAAQADFLAIRDDTYVLRSAPREVQRAAETLVHAQRFSGYWGGAEDAIHYAYLSRRYSEIALLQSRVERNQEQIARLERTIDHLQFALRESAPAFDEQRIDLAAEESNRGLLVTLDDVLFADGSFRLNRSANRILLRLARFLQFNPLRRVRVEGYADNRGDADDNLTLSRKRAQAVADMLIDLGVDPEQVERVGYGERFRVADNASGRGRARNRRVEIIFSDEQGAFSIPR
nr:OmpA family protein [Azomonas macrocytogenes]